MKIPLTMFEKMIQKSLFLFLIAVLFFTVLSEASDEFFSISGELSSNLIWDEQNSNAGKIGIQYIPTIDFASQHNSLWKWDMEASSRIYGSTRFHDFFDHHTTRGKIVPYRLWARLSSSQTEFRLGLQKINFGPATLLRTLRWFDTLDPKDPLHLTDGVYALLYRHYFLSNATFWMWGLYGNEDLKGNETLATKKDHPEGGVRYQSPLFRGEMALTIHHRTIDTDHLKLNNSHASENRIGIDGRWDLGPGLWFESALVQKEIKAFVIEKYLTLGLDYTVDKGNGLTLLGEHFSLVTSKQWGSIDNPSHISALMLTYPISLIDTLSLISFYYWDQNQYDLKLSLKRHYNTISFYLSGFYANHRPMLHRSVDRDRSFSGTGVQLMMVWNH